MSKRIRAKELPGGIRVYTNGKVEVVRGGAWTEVKPSKQVSGHLSVRINGKTLYVHRLVAEAYIGPVEGKIVSHKNDIPSDNRIENLEVTDQRTNVMTGQRNNCGIGRHKLTDAQIAELRVAYAAGVPVSRLVTRYGVSSTSVYHHVSDLPRQQPMRSGSSGKSSRLSEAQIIDIVERREAGQKLKAIAEDVGVGVDHLLRIVHRYNPPPRRQLTHEEAKQAISMYRSGQSRREIADELGVTVAAVRRVCRGPRPSDPQGMLSTETVVSIRQAYANGIRIADIANDHGISQSYASLVATGIFYGHLPGAMPARYHKWTPEEIETVIRRRETGEAVAEIARSYGVTTNRLHAVIRKQQQKKTATIIDIVPTADADGREVA